MKIGDLTCKVTVDTLDLDMTIKKLREINRLFNMIDLKKRVIGLLSYLKVKKK